MRRHAKKLRAWIVSPLGLLLLGTLLASVLIPHWSAISDDRKAELALKTGLVERMATSTTGTVRDASSLVQRPPSNTEQRYRALKRSWLTSRADLQTVIGTNFSEDAARCWFLFSDLITDYVSIPQPNVASQAPTQRLRSYVGDEQAACAPLEDVPGYSQQRYATLRRQVGDFSALSATSNTDFKTAYDNLGALLLIDRDRLVRTIVDSDARGFAHGWSIFGSVTPVS